MKLHTYTREKLLESHATFHLINCHSGAFSPFGDKIALGSSAGIFIIDSYTFEVFCIISPGQILNKVPKNIEFTSPFDLVAEISSGNSSYLAEITNYKKVKILGQVQLPSNYIVAPPPFENSSALSSHHHDMDRSSSKLIEVDLNRKIIIVVIPGKQLRFFNM